LMELDTILWISLIGLQIFSAGNMVYQQEHGMWEINPIYSDNPSRERIYITKAIQLGAVYGATKIWPRHKRGILIGSNSLVIGFIIRDYMVGVEMQMSL